LLEVGAKRVVFGSGLLQDGKINIALAKDACSRMGPEHLTFAIDSRNGKVAIKGWKEKTSITPTEMIQALEPYCSAFLYTHIDTEGTMGGFPIEVAKRLREATSRQLIVAGGIKSMEEVDALDAIGADAVVGMAIYKGVVNA
jgi:phosphoribosylformimino-5-aminoimidazole carboxamide ribotide isomerase